jgi:3-carboxy-cis,cis-muconate cycloisomerase
MNATGIFEPLLTDGTVGDLLGDAAMARAMVTVERALARVEGRLGVIEPEAAAAIEAALGGHQPELAELTRGTAEAGVPVPALVAQLRRAVGGEAQHFVHWGATSQDIVDTALVLCLREAVALIEGRLAALVRALAGLADAHRATPMVARTRFQQAVPTTFGLKAAGWLAPLARHRQRLRELAPRLLVVQLGGAAGNLAALGDRGVAVMEALAAELGLGCPPMPWHNQRDGLVELASWLALLTGSLGKMGQDVLLLAQSEVGEVREAEGGGSSTMPQKSNPIRAEALVTLARRNAAAAAGMHEAALHAHERDGAAWQLEWTVLPGMVSAAAAALGHGEALARTAVVDPGRMRATLEASRGLPLAEPVSFALARHVPRAEAQALVKAACREAVASGRDLLEVVAERTTAPVDWDRVRAEAERPPAAATLIDRVLDAAATSERGEER